MFRANKVKSQIRKKYGSYNYFAKNLGVDRSSITKWLNGSRSPSYHTAVRITRMLDITLEDIYGPTK